MPGEKKPHRLEPEGLAAAKVVRPPQPPKNPQLSGGVVGGAKEREMASQRGWKGAPPMLQSDEEGPRLARLLRHGSDGTFNGFCSRDVALPKPVFGAPCPTKEIWIGAFLFIMTYSH